MENRETATQVIDEAVPENRFRLVLVRVASWGGGLAVMLLAGAIWIGIPGWLAERLLETVNSGDWFCEVSRLTLDPRGGVVAHRLHVYRKGLAGPPCVEAERARVRYALFDTTRKDQSRLREVTVVHGVVRPWQRMAAKGAGGGKTIHADGAGAGSLPALEMVLRLEDVDLLGVAVRRAQARVRMDSSALSFSGVEVRVGDEVHEGSVQGDVERKADGHLLGHLATRIDPRAVHPFLQAVGLDMASVLDRFSFHGEAPALDMTFEAPAGTGRAATVAGRFQASQFAYQGAAVGFANITWNYESGEYRHRLILNPMVLVMADRSVTGGITVDFGKGWVDGEVVSTAELPTLVRLIGLPQGWIPGTWSVGGQERVYAKGRYAYEDRALTAMEVVAEGRDLRIGRFRADEISLKWLMKGVTNELADIRGRIAGGSFTAGATLVPEGVPSTRSKYAIKGEILHAELGELLEMAVAGVATGVEGKVYGNIQMEGVLGGRPEEVAGRGELNIRRGRIFSIPLFGGLTQALASRFPGVDMLVLQREARATFDVGAGKVSSRDIRLDGDVFAIEAEGDCGLDGRLGFVVKVKPVTERKLIGPALRTLTLPLSKLLEFKVEGTLRDPRWKSTAFSWQEWFNGDSKREKQAK